ncbi:MAG TPA: mandelate racemase/muconate lactonizing enzyme family protein, partial [Kineosporiaceae bacterium]|nr:mandelate racemase/muconate lactonizing enzyme family protein [Kineosporiaceae bacterium]
QDPRRQEFLYQAMYRDHFFQGGVVTMSALSGIDQALHDIKAKALGVPAYQLLGGAVRDRVRMYDHLGGGESGLVYGAATAERFGEAAARSVNDGFTALKILAVPIGPALVGHADLQGAVAAMAAVREAVGDDVDIMVDLHGRTTIAGALAYGRALAEFRPWFFEEPVQPGNPRQLLEVARALPFPVATGERLIALEEFRDLLDLGGVAVLQPDVCHVGGPTGLRKIAALAESHRVALAPHNPLGPVATAVNQHLGFALPGFLLQEVMRSDVPWRDEVVIGGLPITNGYVTLPTEPGWGVEVDEVAAAQHPYEPEPQLNTVLPDGAVGDW